MAHPGIGGGGMILLTAQCVTEETKKKFLKILVSRVAAYKLGGASGRIQDFTNTELNRT